MTPIDRPFFLLLVTYLLAFFIDPTILLISGLLSFDCAARYREFLRVRHEPFSCRMARVFATTWCGRGVYEFIHRYKATAYYRHLGYRWYHVMPDGFPSSVTTLAFWKGVVGLNLRR